jgi:hypothetical protein
VADYDITFAGAQLHGPGRLRRWFLCSRPPGASAGGDVRAGPSGTARRRGAGPARHGHAVGRGFGPNALVEYRGGEPHDGGSGGVRRPGPRPGLDLRLLELLSGQLRRGLGKSGYHVASGHGIRDFDRISGKYKLLRSAPEPFPVLSPLGELEFVRTGSVFRRCGDGIFPGYGAGASAQGRLQELLSSSPEPRLREQLLHHSRRQSGDCGPEHLGHYAKQGSCKWLSFGHHIRHRLRD